MREISGIFADENILPVGRRLAKLPEADRGTALMCRETNHTPEFWSTVSRLMPGYDVQKANLAAIGKNVWLGAVADSAAR